MSQFAPRLHNEVYPFIAPSKFRGKLQSQVVVITGAAGTLGRALAECFAVSGAKLILVYNRTEPGANHVQRCTELGASSVTLIQCNVSSLEACTTLVAKIKEAGDTIDVLINNAGVDSLGPMHSYDPKKFLDDMAVNLNGPYFLTRLFLPIFMEKRTGCVLNIASRGGTMDFPFNANYSVSKTALIRLTGCLQGEMDAMGYKDIHMYSIHPGAVPSEMTSSDAAIKALGDLPHVLEQFGRALAGFKDSPYLNGMTCVALATGLAKDVLRGKYYDAQQDLEDVIAQAEHIQADPRLYGLHTTFLAGLPNNGGTEHCAAEAPVDFPGF